MASELRYVFLVLCLNFGTVLGGPSYCNQCVTCAEENGNAILAILMENLGSTAGVKSQLKSFDTMFEFVSNFGGNRCPSSLVSETTNKTLDAEGSSCITMVFNFYGTGPYSPFESYLGCSIMGSVEDFYEDPQMAVASPLTATNIYADLKKVSGSSYFLSDRFTASISICDSGDNCNDQVPGYETYEVLWEIDEGHETDVQIAAYMNTLNMWWDYALCPQLYEVISDCHLDRLENYIIRDDGRNSRVEVLMQIVHFELMPLNPMTVEWVTRELEHGFDRLATANKIQSNLDVYLIDDILLMGHSQDDMVLNIYKVSKYSGSNVPMMT